MVITQQTKEADLAEIGRIVFERRNSPDLEIPVVEFEGNIGRLTASPTVMLDALSDQVSVGIWNDSIAKHRIFWGDRGVAGVPTTSIPDIREVPSNTYIEKRLRTPVTQVGEVGVLETLRNYVYANPFNGSITDLKLFIAPPDLIRIPKFMVYYADSVVPLLLKAATESLSRHQDALLLDFYFALFLRMKGKEANQPSIDVAYGGKQEIGRTLTATIKQYAYDPIEVTRRQSGKVNKKLKG